MNTMLRTPDMQEAYEKAKTVGGVVSLGEGGLYEVKHPFRKRFRKKSMPKQRERKNKWVGRKSRNALAKSWFHDTKSSFIQPRKVVMTREQYEAMQQRLEGN